MKSIRQFNYKLMFICYVQGTRGNTPLHYACLLEKIKHVELLLEYGAIPDARNQYGQVPLQMLPGNSVRSTKLFLKKMFEDAMAKARDAESAIRSDVPVTSSRNDL